MNSFFYAALLAGSLLLASQSIDKTGMANAFYEATNFRDTAAMSKLMHEDFHILSKDGEFNDWDKHKWLERPWCNECFKDTFRIISMEEKADAVIVITEHKSEVLRLLEVPYFRDRDAVYFKDNKIYKIVRDTLPGYKAQSDYADKKFKKFSQWFYKKYPDVDIHNQRLIPILEEYASRKNKKKTY